MPIPPRPIPVHAHHHHHTTHRSTPQPRSAKPGSSVPRKSLGLGLSSSLDWRAEVALLGDRSRSVPVNELGGVRVVDVDGRDKSNNGIGIGPDGGMALTTGTGTGKEVEVGLMELIEGGRGKREKRATTATTLGFDFIPNPSVLVLPDTELAGAAAASTSTSISPNKQTVAQAKPSLLSRSPLGFLVAQPPVSTPNTIQAIQAGNPTSAIADLANTPSTPGLIAARSGSSDFEAEDEDDDEWEQISEPDMGTELREVEEDQVDEEGEEEEEGELIVLGELELDDCVGDATETVKKGDIERMGAPRHGVVGKQGRISYAAALGGAARS